MGSFDLKSSLRVPGSYLGSFLPIPYKSGFRPVMCFATAAPRARRAVAVLGCRHKTPCLSMSGDSMLQMKAFAAAAFAVIFFPAHTISAQTASFESFVKSYYDGEYAAHPVAATSAGIHDYDGKVDDMSADGQARNDARLHEALAALEGMNPQQLSPGDRDDREVLMGRIKGTLLDDETIKYWRKDPSRYSRVATLAVFELVHRDFAPLADRLRAAIAREQEIPAVLAAGKANIEHAPRAFVEIAIRNMAGSINFYRDGAPKAFAAVEDPQLKRDFASSNDAAIAAFEDYKAFLETQLSKADGDFALKSEVFVERLTDNEMVALTVTKLRDIALRQLHRDQAALKAAAREVDPAKSVGAVVEDIRRQHPNADTLLPTAEEDLSGLRAFVSKHRLVTIPSELLPTVEVTPAFLRATTAAAMDPPGPFEHNATQAFYYVSPPDAGMTAEKLEDYLQAYYFSGLQLISAHEVWPGHFMQYLTRRNHPQWSLARKLAHAQSTTEGWAHYAEQMMIEQGLAESDPKLKVAQLNEALVRDCRFIASIEMHTAGKSVEDAAQLFMRECGSPQAEARREAYRGTSDPGYLNYTIGKLEILKLREDYKKAMGTKFSLAEFHDRFLAAGLVPVKIIRREMMGVDAPLL
jgi:uncharacterized protein (DUF885 family)